METNDNTIVIDPIILQINEPEIQSIIIEPEIQSIIIEPDIVIIPEIIQKPVLKKSKTIGILKPFVWN